MSEERFHTTGWDSQQVRRQAGGERVAPSQPRRRKKKRGNPILAFILWVFFVVIASAIMAEVGWLLANDLCAFNKEYREVEVTVEEGDRAEDIARKLKENGLIEYKWFFRLFSVLAKLDDKIDDGRIGVGEHLLTTDMDYRALITGLYGTKRTADTVKVMIPEGYTVQQIIDLLAEKKVNTKEALTEAAENYVFADYAFIDNENLGDIRRLEGFLYPDTYEFYVWENPADALKRFLDNFSRRIDAEMMELIDESGWSLKEIVTIASLIEKETAGNDREVVASVIYNRLKNTSYETVGMLQFDASLVYATGHAQLTAEDLALDSPYNLSKNTGLPPTPICNPGRACIWAALAPAETDYYYFYLGKDNQLIFSKTYAEHQRVIASQK